MPSETANVVTKLFGYNENENLRSSAIPLFLDEWFHGDFTVDRPNDLSTARGSKSPEEYTQSFPDYRLNSAIEIQFDTNGQLISNPSAAMTDPDDPNSPGGSAPVTLEGAPDEPTNPFRTTFDYDGGQDYLYPTENGPYTKEESVGPIDGIEGYRASIIFGGSDPYLERLREDIDSLSEVTDADIPEFVTDFIAHVPAFYSFLDFVFMADGTQLVRVWDASVYPAHALYVGGTLQDRNVFREGIEWVPQGPIGTNNAFRQFAIEGSLTPGATPFDKGGAWGYRKLYDKAGSGPHPVMIDRVSGSSLSARTVESELSNPLFPDEIPPI